jgi:hypothetical protein
MQVYVPSMVIVILSWVSFWINADASAARALIGLFTVLTITLVNGGARASLPKMSYITAIDLWMIGCLVFVISSVIEYVVVNVLVGGLLEGRRRRRNPTDNISMTGRQQPPSTTVDVKDSSSSQPQHQVRYFKIKISHCEREEFPPDTSPI